MPGHPDGAARRPWRCPCRASRPRRPRPRRGRRPAPRPRRRPGPRSTPRSAGQVEHHPPSPSARPAQSCPPPRTDSGTALSRATSSAVRTSSGVERTGPRPPAACRPPRSTRAGRRRTVVVLPPHLPRTCARNRLPSSVLCVISSDPLRSDDPPSVRRGISRGSRSGRGRCPDGHPLSRRGRPSPPAPTAAADGTSRSRRTPARSRRSGRRRASGVPRRRTPLPSRAAGRT